MTSQITRSLSDQEKQDWIDALEATIQMWDNVLHGHIKSRCSLCIKARHNYSPYPNKYECEGCIHLSSFGQKNTCVRQLSYINATRSNKAIPYRISYLRKIQNKLKASMK